MRYWVVTRMSDPTVPKWGCVAMFCCVVCCMGQTVSGCTAPTPTRKGQIYRYYIAKTEARVGLGSKTHQRIPAEAVEAPTIAQIKTVLASPESIAAVWATIQQSPSNRIEEASVVLAMHQVGNVWDQLYPAEAASSGQPDDRAYRYRH